jgi:GTP1/Obg family GTP-binding protein
MKTCPYCDFVYETQEELYEHLNKTHTRCPCGTVWNNKDAPDNYYYTYCPECYKKEILEEEE